MTRNLCLNHLTRHRSRRQLFSELASEEGENPAEKFAAPDTFAANIEGKEKQALLAEALEKLPDAQRVPLVLYHMEDMSYEAIAQCLNVSLAKVRIDIHRGRLALRRILTLDPEARPS